MLPRMLRFRHSTQQSLLQVGLMLMLCRYVLDSHTLFLLQALQFTNEKQAGKIANKVLKLTAEVLGIQIEAAQGGDDSDLAAEQTKLAKNIATDKASAGQAMQSVDFTGTS